MEVDPSDDNDEKFNPNIAQDDDDPVVDEIPVYLSKSLQCYLFQYPVRPESLSYDRSLVTKARFRPKNQQVQLEMRLDTNSDNYDRGKGEQFALNTDGCNAASSSDRYFKSNIMDKQTLMGSSVVSEGGGGRYAVGRLQGKELHLTEVQGVLQLRPSLGYMDKSDKTARAEGRVKDDPDDPDAEDEKQPQAVTVKFSRGDSDRVQKMKEKTYDYQMKKVEEEQWMECEYHSAVTVKSREVCDKLKCNQTDHKISSMNQSHVQYLSYLKDSHG